MALRLGTIEEERAACEKAFKGVPVGALAWHCHHDQLIERLSEPAENRIAFILKNKPEGERALRLHLFRPVKTQDLPPELQAADAKCRAVDAKCRAVDAEWRAADAKRQAAYAKRQAAYAEWRAADVKWREAYAELQEAYAEKHSKECKDCPWDGHTILPGVE